jgi:hypothetical protein
MPYFQCPACQIKVHVPNSYLQQAICPICDMALAPPKGIPAGLDPWLPVRARQIHAARRRDTSVDSQPAARPLE